MKLILIGLRVIRPNLKSIRCVSLVTFGGSSMRLTLMKEESTIGLLLMVIIMSLLHTETKALKALKEIESLGYGNLPVCIAKTQYSLSDDPKKLGRP
jgi:hypothetical protein